MEKLDFWCRSGFVFVLSEYGNWLVRRLREPVVFCAENYKKVFFEVCRNILLCDDLFLHQGFWHTSCAKPELRFRGIWRWRILCVFGVGLASSFGVRAMDTVRDDPDLPRCIILVIVASFLAIDISLAGIAGLLCLPVRSFCWIGEQFQWSIHGCCIRQEIGDCS